MAELYRPSYFQPLSDVGAIQSGAKLHFYATGTTTALTIYSDAAATTPVSNPVIADSAGRFAATYVAEESYKVVLTESDDTVIETVDPYNANAVTGATVVTSAANLKTLDTGANTTAIYDGSLWQRNLAASFTSEIAGDTEEVLYLTSSHDTDYVWIRSTALDPRTGGYSVNDGTGVNLVRYDRAFLGDAIDYNGENTSGTPSYSWVGQTDTVAADTTARLPGMGWIERGAQLAVGVGHGKVAISGYARTQSGSGGATIGLLGFAENGSASTASAWGAYIEGRRNPGATGTTWGIELNAVNHDTLVTDTAYGASGNAVVRALDIVAGGDSSVNGTTNNISVGVRFGANGALFDKGMIFTNAGIASQGSYKQAIEMAPTMRMYWMASSGNLGAFIQSDVTTTGAGAGIRFVDSQIDLEDLSGAVIATFDRVASAVNQWEFTPAATSGQVVMQPKSAVDANVTALLKSKGTGEVRTAGGNATPVIRVANSAIGFFNTAPASQQTITGALSSVSDSNAQDVLTSIISLFTTTGLGTDGTT